MFKTQNIKIDEHGLDLIKNYLIISHIDYSEIIDYKITKDFLLNRWKLSFIIGTILSISNLYLIIELFSNWLSNYDLNRIGVNSYTYFMITPFILFICGLFVVITSLSKTLKLTIITSNRTIKLSLRDLEKVNRIEELNSFLEKRIDSKIVK